MKTLSWMVLVLGALGACSSEEAGIGSNADCAALNASCESSSECCPGSLCASSFGNPLEGFCTQICETSAECDSGCCHAIENSDQMVCDIAIACDDGTGGTAGTSGAGGSGAMSTGGTAAGSEGGAGAPQCEDTDAPGLFPFDALELAATSDCNKTPLVHSGEALSPEDSDWFSFGVTDEGLCAIEGSASATGGEIELCAFGDLANCHIVCSTGTAANHEGYDGCCAVGTDPSLAWTTSCSIGESASGTMLLQVTSTGDVCVPYELSYGF